MALETTDETAQALQAKLENTARTEWGRRDPAVQVASVLHGDGKVDLTVVSALFEGRDGSEREADFWPVFAALPRSELVRMTYCLLVTPGEAARLGF